MKHLNSTRQSGFTLVEIAIVLVIIGLLLGGVLKGQEMINNSRVKNAINDMNGVSAAFNSYFDRFRRTPGDDGPFNILAARGGSWLGWNANRSGNNNGVLEVPAANTFDGGAVESVAFFAQLKAAGFITGNPADIGVAALPRNAFNGLTGVTSQQAAAILNNMRGNKVCMSEVPGQAARAIDTALDDGIGNTGTVRSTIGVAGANTIPGASVAAYVDTNVYTVCREL